MLCRCTGVPSNSDVLSKHPVTIPPNYLLHMICQTADLTVIIRRQASSSVHFCSLLTATCAIVPGFLSMSFETNPPPPPLLWIFVVTYREIVYYTLYKRESELSTDTGQSAVCACVIRLGTRSSIHSIRTSRTRSDTSTVNLYPPRSPFSTLSLCLYLPVSLSLLATLRLEQNDDDRSLLLSFFSYFLFSFVRSLVYLLL